ncbi:hypothetical protein FB451DRAFT_1421271 [Mycena latifolia]|nr:hypothetical protein FB451DRAFT_1421271 [Mycena latifolia]
MSSAALLDLLRDTVLAQGPNAPPLVLKTQFDEALDALVARNAPVRIQSPEHAQMLCSLIIGLHVFAFFKEIIDSVAEILDY